MFGLTSILFGWLPFPFLIIVEGVVAIFVIWSVLKIFQIVKELISLI